MSTNEKDVPVSEEGVPEGDQFVNVEEQPRKVADEENEDEAHEDGRQVVLEAAAALVDVLPAGEGEGMKGKEEEEEEVKWPFLSPRPPSSEAPRIDGQDHFLYDLIDHFQRSDYF